MSTETLSQKPTVLGGWSTYGPLTAEDKVVFDEAIKSIIGVDYTPTAVSTQVVNGVNYKFKCTASIPPAEVVWEAIVEIYQAPGSAPVVTGIIRL